MFHWIEFWAVGWLWNQADILWYHQRFGPMPARPIHLHHDEILLESLADMLQEQLHHRGVRCWQNQGRQLSVGGRHSGIDISVLPHHLPWGAGPDAWRCPGAPGDAHPAKAALILGHL